MTGTGWVTRVVAARMTAVRTRPRPPRHRDIHQGCRLGKWHWLWCWGRRPAHGGDNGSDSGRDGGGQQSRSHSQSHSASPIPSGSKHSAQEAGSDTTASGPNSSDTVPGPSGLAQTRLPCTERHSATSLFVSPLLCSSLPPNLCCY